MNEEREQFTATWEELVETVEKFVAGYMTHEARKDHYHWEPWTSWAIAKAAKALAIVAKRWGMPIVEFMECSEPMDVQVSKVLERIDERRRSAEARAREVAGSIGPTWQHDYAAVRALLSAAYERAQSIQTALPQSEQIRRLVEATGKASGVSLYGDPSICEGCGRNLRLLRTGEHPGFGHCRMLPDDYAE